MVHAEHISEQDAQHLGGRDITTASKATTSCPVPFTHKAGLLQPPKHATDSRIGISSTGPFITDVRRAGGGSTDLKAAITEGLMRPATKPGSMRSIPEVVLYDERGLQLFEDIMELEEYYLTESEVDILERHAAELVAYMRPKSESQDGPCTSTHAAKLDGSHDSDNHLMLVELGSGSLRKTKILLDAFENARVPTSYYALDVSYPSLATSIRNLHRNYEYVTLHGLLGTYQDVFAFLQAVPGSTRKCVMWLGSSMGNLERDKAAGFLSELRDSGLNDGDWLVLGVDKPNDPKLVEKAYNDSLGVTRKFILNGLSHVNHIFGRTVLDASKVEYHCQYNTNEARHESYYRCLQDQRLDLGGDDAAAGPVMLKKDELILIEYSHKYSVKQLHALVEGVQLRNVATFSSSNDMYSLTLCQRPPFYFKSDPARYRNGGVVPKLSDWKELWKAYDAVTIGCLTPAGMMQRPVDLRNELIFYVGHAPAFVDSLLSHEMDLPLTQPTAFAHMFERGKDPDVETGQCHHAHSICPSAVTDWPAISDILAYRDHVRRRIVSLYDGDTLSFAQASRAGAVASRSRKRLQRGLWLAFEHEAMHLETLLYMIVQLPSQRGYQEDHPYFLRPPPFHLLSGDPSNLGVADWIHCRSRAIDIGMNDPEDMDLADPHIPYDAPRFGWDNEKPTRCFNVEPFSIQSRPISVAEYEAFLNCHEDKLSLVPATWSRSATGGRLMKTMFGQIPMEYCRNWPVYISYEQAEAFCGWKGNVRLPTEAELRVFYEETSSTATGTVTYGFRHWAPVNMDRFDRQGWEWTSTVFRAHEGFKPSTLYPGYSNDFLEGKHNIVLGAGFATHPCLAERPTFRNWFQRKYPYAFVTFRCVSLA